MICGIYIIRIPHGAYHQSSVYSKYINKYRLPSIEFNEQLGRTIFYFLIHVFFAKYQQLWLQLTT